MKNNSRIEATLIRCSNCSFPLLKQTKGITVKSIDVLRKGAGIRGNLIINIPHEKDKKIPIKIICPRCKRMTPVTFIVEELTGITFSFKGECLETIGKRTTRITEKNERKLKKIHLKLKP